MVEYTPEVKKLLEEGYIIEGNKLIAPPKKYESYIDRSRPQDTKTSSYNPIEYTFDPETGRITSRTERNLYQSGGGSRYKYISPYEKRIETYNASGNISQVKEYKTIPVGTRGIEEPRLYISTDYEQGTDYTADFKTPSIYKTKPTVTEERVTAIKVGEKTYGVTGPETIKWAEAKAGRQTIILERPKQELINQRIGKREQNTEEQILSRQSSPERVAYVSSGVWKEFGGTLLYGKEEKFYDAKYRLRVPVKTTDEPVKLIVSKKDSITGVQNKPFYREMISNPPTEKTSLWSKAESWVSERTTKKLLPVTSKIEKIFSNTSNLINQYQLNPIGFVKAITSAERTDKGIKISFNTPSASIPSIKAKYESNYATGYYEGIREEPLKTGVTITAFALLPGILKGAGRVINFGGRLIGVSEVANPIAKYGIKMVSGAVKYGLPIIYSGTVALRVASSDNPARTFGKISSTEIVPMFAGSAIGQSVWPKAIGYIRTRRLEEVPTKDLVPGDVISGKTRFPEGPMSSDIQLKMFEKSPYKLPGSTKPTGFHATSSEIKLDVGAGSSEIPGLYVSYGVSPHFLRVSGEASAYGGKLFEPFPTPRIGAITPKKFSIGRIMKTSSGTYDFVSEVNPSRAYVPNVGRGVTLKAEVEAIIPEGGRLEFVKSDYFTRWGGVRVPIYEFRTSDAGKYFVSGGKIVSGVSGSSIGGGSIYSSTPGTYFVGSTLGVSGYLSDSFVSVNNIGFNSISSSTYTKVSQPVRVVSSRPSSSVSSVASNEIVYFSSSPKRSYSQSSSSVSSVSSISSSNVSSVASSRSSSSVSRVRDNISYSNLYSSQTSFSPPPPPPTKFKRHGFGDGLFIVSVRRGGQWKSYAQRETLNEALRTGKTYTYNTAGASFRITPRSNVGREELSRVDLGGMYYRSKKEENVFIEKPRFRIKSQGEKAEISLRGAFAQRKKKKNKGLII